MFIRVLNGSGYSQPIFVEHVPIEPIEVFDDFILPPYV